MKKLEGSAYFSHSIVTYNSEDERKVYDYLTNSFDGKIICPNKDLGILGDKDDYAKIASRADVVFVWCGNNNQIISRGCYAEVVEALQRKRQVYYVVLEKDTIKLKEVVHVHPIMDYNKEYAVATVQ
jgi:hypothetical protein